MSQSLEPGAWYISFDPSTMYLSQELSTVLFTIIRLALQLSSVLLISHIASRTYNLTYQERINGGFLNGISYLFFTEFQRNRKHVRGRLYVALTLTISVALTFLPTLLSKLYPVKPTFLPSSMQELDVAHQFIKTTNIAPGQTSVENILFSMGIQLNGSVFDRYVAPVPRQEPCQPFPNIKSNSTVLCVDDKVSIGGFPKDNQSLFAGYRHDGIGFDKPLNAIHAGSQFKYFNLSNLANEYTTVDMFRNTAQVFAGDLQDMDAPGSNSIAACFLRGDSINRCIRHSLGYFLSEKFNLYLISRRAFSQTHHQILDQIYDFNNPQNIDPHVNVTFDCKIFPTSTLETMCRQLNSLGAPPLSQVFSMQKRTRDSDGTTRWDIITTYVGYFVPSDLKRRRYTLAMEAFHIEVNITSYNTTINQEKAMEVTRGLHSFLSFMGQEVFETTHTVDEVEAELAYDRSWLDRGFSDDDIRNLTNFIILGTLLNNGTIMLQTPLLLANIPNLAVGLLLGSALLMVVLGFVSSRKIDSAVRDPLTEMFPMVLAPKNQPSDEPKNFVISLWLRFRYFFRKRRVANIALLPQTDGYASDNNNDATSDRTIKMFRLHMEIDGESKEDAIQMLERVRSSEDNVSSQQSLAIV
ncbi:hypothetical protein DFQ27_005692 [Actinomortierella ambigua]|uniref:Uncharacterized protein n=1 Tax=Actinomortierella ambigua TaxID=1343610 RepID=A0A9P6Q0Q0_9FUNG|nr:hypothetical protein DFQ27_005692 [Actinomortierella ambigua]